MYLGGFGQIDEYEKEGFSFENLIDLQDLIIGLMTSVAAGLVVFYITRRDRGK